MVCSGVPGGVSFVSGVGGVSRVCRPVRSDYRSSAMSESETPPPARSETGSVPVAEGVLISADGEVSVDEGLTETLLDLAEALEERTGRPVDVEHVVAAVVLANRAGNIGSEKRLRTGDDLLLMALAPHVETVFAKYGGRVAEDDSPADGRDEP